MPILTYSFAAPAPSEQSHVAASNDPDGYRFDVCVTPLDENTSDRIQQAVQGGRRLSPDPQLDAYTMRVQLDASRSLAINGSYVRGPDGRTYQVTDEQGEQADHIALETISERGCIGEADRPGREWALRELNEQSRAQL